MNGITIYFYAKFKREKLRKTYIMLHGSSAYHAAYASLPKRQTRDVYSLGMRGVLLLLSLRGSLGAGDSEMQQLCKVRSEPMNFSSYR